MTLRQIKWGLYNWRGFVCVYETKGSNTRIYRTSHVAAAAGGVTRDIIFDFNYHHNLFSLSFDKFAFITCLP